MDEKISVDIKFHQGTKFEQKDLTRFEIMGFLCDKVNSDDVKSIHMEIEREGE